MPFARLARPAGALALSWLAVASAAPATAQTVAAQADVIKFESFTPADQQLISETVALATEQVNSARQDLQGANIQPALYKLTTARRLLNAILVHSPPARAKTLMGRIKDFLMKSTAPSSDDLQPIYTEIDDYSQMTDATVVREHLDKAKTALGAKKMDVFEAELGQASNTIVATQIDAPIKETIEYIDRARSALMRSDPGEAQAQLSAAARNLKTITDVTAVTTKAVWNGVEDTTVPASGQKK